VGVYWYVVGGAEWCGGRAVGMYGAVVCGGRAEVVRWACMVRGWCGDIVRWCVAGAMGVRHTCSKSMMRSTSKVCAEP
jgi:hypothetical protein